jgi:ATP-binding cassette subfamily F protein uup
LAGSGAASAPAASAPSSPARRRDAQKEARRLERRLDALVSREGELHAALAEAATDAPRLLRLDAELREVLAERTRVEEDWLAAAELAEG